MWELSHIYQFEVNHISYWKYVIFSHKSNFVSTWCISEQQTEKILPQFWLYGQMENYYETQDNIISFTLVPDEESLHRRSNNRTLANYSPVTEN